jgi:hypothetical protein
MRTRDPTLDPASAIMGKQDGAEGLYVVSK